MDLPDTWTPPTGRYNAGADLVDRHLPAGRGRRTAFVDARRELTYAALAERTDRFGNALRGLGLRREDRVVLLLLDTVDFPVAFWGAIKAGVVAVPINTLLPPDQWQYMIEDSRAAAVVISAELLERAGPMLARLHEARGLIVVATGGAGDGGTVLDFERVVGAGLAEPPGADTHADEVAFWLYTSGSTGIPKGARHVHASPVATAELFGRGVVGFREDDVVFSAAKLFFAYGLGNGMSFPLAVGATTALLAERPTPETVLATMARHQPTVFCGVPTLYAALLAAPALGRGAGSARLRVCLSAGEALPADVGLRWRDLVGIDILDGIGSTEMLHMFITNRPGDVRYGTTGKPVPGYEARIVDESGAPVAPGTMGELLIKGPTAAEGYWNRRERSRRTFLGEWTRTGDKYWVDDEGYYRYCGRTDDMFKVSGIWVAPFEVESALVSHPAVLEAAVVGQEDEEGLMKPKAFVVLNAGYEPTEPLFEELRAHVKETAGPWKYPRWIEVLAELPKTATGKIQRFKLRSG
jgi:4-hydroxybenzoate-CoA ligase